MKKLLTLMLSGLLCITTLPVSAETTYDENINKDQNEESVKVIARETIGDETRIEIEVLGDREEFLFIEEKVGDLRIIEMYDKNNQLITTLSIMEIEHNKQPTLKMLADYESWNEYSNDKSGTITSSTRFSLMTLSMVCSVILYAVNPVSFVLGNTLTVASAFLQIDDTKAYYRRYTGMNRNCSILYRVKMVFYKYSNYTGQIGDPEYGWLWTDTPWNYEYPAPCRTLESTYSYD